MCGFLLTNIKSKAGNIGNSDKLLADIEQLKGANKQLIEQLESSGINLESDLDSDSPQKYKSSSTLILIIIFIFGVFGGALILDYINRRRHGGFRV